MPGLWSTPRWNVGPARSDVMTSTGGTPRALDSIAACASATLAKLCHQASVLRVEPSLVHRRRAAHSDSVGVLVNSTVACHVACTTTDTTYDVSCEVALFRTVVFSVTETATILTNLVFVVTKGTVQCSKLAELIALVVILTFGSGGSLGNLQQKVKDRKLNFLLFQ